MASARVQGAAQGASIGGKIGGPVGAGIGAVLGALGGKGSYAQTTGIEVRGTLSKAGFSGRAYGLASNGGAQYRDVLAPSSGPYFHIAANLAEAFGKYFGPESDAVLPVGFVIPADQVNDFGRFVQGQVQAAAPVPTSTKPSGLSALVSAFTGGGDAPAPEIRYNAPGASVSAPSQPAPAAGDGYLLQWLALAFGAFYVVKHV